jgi:hypothetical protein
MKTEKFMRQKNNPGALINIDNSSLDAYKKQREIMRNMKTHEERIQNIEFSLQEIKNLLIKSLENGNNK